MRGAASKAIQELAGHQELSMTQRYMHLSPAVAESAIRLLEAPVLLNGDGDILETAQSTVVKLTFSFEKKWLAVRDDFRNWFIRAS